MATIIIRRKSSWIGSVQSHNVYIQDDFVGELKSGGILRITTEVGTYLLSFNSTMKWLGINSTFNVVVNEPDEVVELRTKFGMNGYEVKYADNKVHLPASKKETIKSEISNTEAHTLLDKNDIFERISFDALDGAEFEEWCANLLRRNAFINVEKTKASGDQGVDILAEKGEIKYAIQCKCYSSDLGNSPIQEVHAGKSMYNCHVGVVMTNRHFTSGAKELAKATGVLLWDREKLLQMMSNVEETIPTYTWNDIDEKFLEAVELALNAGEVSTTLLQRNLMIGYGRAANLINKMEELGIVSNTNGNKPRKVIMSKDAITKMLNRAN